MNDSLTAANAIVPAMNAARPRGFWQWWLGELRALVPPRLMSWVVGDVAVTDVMVDASTISLMRMESGKLTAIVTIPLAEITTHPRLRELRAKGHAQARLLLDARQILQKNISMPAAVEENLREVMGFELDRHTPFTAAQAYFDVKLRKRDAPRESIDVLLAIAARNVVDPLLVTVRQAGLSVESVSAADADPVGQTIELLPASEKPARKWGNLLRLNIALFALAMMFALIALLLPIWQKREAVIALNPVVGKAATEFAVNQRVHDEYVKLANEHNFITGKKQGMHSSLAVLEELTKISPDTTVAQSMDMKTNGKTREVTLMGEALAASKVIESLEQSPLFQNATQRSQTRKGSLGTNEWFHVATELKPKPLPAATIPGEKIPEPVVAPAVVVPAPSTTPAPTVGDRATPAPANSAPASAAPTKPDSAGGSAAPPPVPAPVLPAPSAPPSAPATTPGAAPVKPLAALTEPIVNSRKRS